MPHVSVFLGWSGERSRATATALNEWLPDVLQGVRPWMSDEIPKGEAWLSALHSAMTSAEVGVICLTRENLSSRWIHFESGALFRPNGARVCTFLLDVDPSDVPLPLSAFQSTQPTLGDVTKLLHTINAQLGDDKRSDGQLARALERWWPDLEGRLRAATRMVDSISELPTELTQSFAARRATIGSGKQHKILAFMEKEARAGNAELSQSAVQNDLKVGESETYYRLEQLRLLGFLVKHRDAQRDPWRWRLHPAYRKELDIANEGRGTGP